MPPDAGRRSPASSACAIPVLPVWPRPCAGGNWSGCTAPYRRLAWPDQASPGDAETGGPSVDLAQKSTGTAVPVLHPEVVRVHGFKHQPQHGAFLGMAIFTGKDLTHQAVSRLIDDQRFPRQGTGLHRTQRLEPPFTRFKTVPVNNFHAIPRQPGGALAVKLLEKWRQYRRTLTHQCCRGVGLDPVEFVVDRDEGGPNLVFVVPIGCTHRGLAAKDDLAEQGIDG